MSWTEERIETLRTMWEAGQTASQIAESLGGVSRNAVIGKAHRLGLQSRPSPVKPNEPAAAKAVAPEPIAAPEAASPVEDAPTEIQAPLAANQPVAGDDTSDSDTDTDVADQDAAEPVREPKPVLRSIGPGGFLRQSPGEQAPPSTPAPPRRLVPAKPSAEIAGKTTLLDLNDRICKWPLGHPGEPDFHFCGEKVNPGFPYCVDHCGHAYQAQLPRRDRRPPPPLPFGGPRVR